MNDNMTACKNNLLIDKHPDLLEEWNYDKNTHEGINVNTITCGSHSKIWWLCKHKHSYQMAIYHRVHGRGCPYCTNKRVLPGYNDLQTKYPDLIESEWNHEYNDANNIYPSGLTTGSNVKAGWHCSSCNGDYMMSIKHKIKGQSCPYCTGKQVLVGFNDLASCYPELVDSEWDYASNNANNIRPDEITCGSDVEAHWLCKQYKHAFIMRVNKRTCNQPRGCPYCAGRKVLVGFNDLQSTHPDLVENEWDWIENDKHGLKPDGITQGSHVKIWWHCNTCKGVYDMIVYIKVNMHCGCPYCSGKRVLIGYNDLQSKYPEIAKEWYQPMNGNVTPDMITSKTDKIRIHVNSNNDRTILIKPSWKCSECSHIWQALISNRTSNNSGCPKCSHRISKQETQVADFIGNYLKTKHANMEYTMYRSIKFKKIYEMRKINTNNALSDDLQAHLLKELDIYIPELGLAIEYDGDYWHDDERMLSRCGFTNSQAHRIKQLFCEHVGIELFFITEHDWLNDTVNVKQMLTRIIDNMMLRIKYNAQ